MNNQFDELAKGLAQSVTRRGALKKFGLGLAGLALAALGLADSARADFKKPKRYHCNCKLGWDYGCSSRYGFGDDGAACAQYCAFRCTQVT